MFKDIYNPIVKKFDYNTHDIKWGGVNNGSSWLALIDADVILA